MRTRSILIGKRQYKGAYVALLMASLALVINFWAWTLLSPLGTQIAKDLVLSSTSLALLLAIPVIVGSLGRIVFGVITDKLGGKLVFAAICLLEAIAVSALAFSHTYNALVLAAVFLGFGGASFAIGVPFVSAWFPASKRGLALGIYSMGNAGTAVSAFLTPRLDSAVGRAHTFFLVAGLLVVMSAIFLIYGQNAPSWKPSRVSSLNRIKKAAQSQVTRDLAVVYAITFGAFVAFGVYLPVLLKVAYDLSLTDAAARAAGFILLATIARPIGGWLSDRVGGKYVLRLALMAIIGLAGCVAFQPALGPQTTIAYLSMAFTLGCANGSVFALVGKLSKPDITGSVTGIVGATGGLGGFFPLLVLGFTYQKTHSYSIALLMLSLSALVVFLYINQRFKSPVYKLQGYRA